MKNIAKKTLSVFLALAMTLSLFTGLYVTANAEPASAIQLAGGQVITQNGTYQLTADAAGAITVATGVTDVTIIGNGIAYNNNVTDTSSTGYGYITSTPNAVTVDCSAAAGIHLTLQNFYDSVKTNTANVLNFSGTGNRLTISGTCLLDYDVGYTSSNDALIHVAKGSSLTMDGSGTLYQYNCTQGAGIGGNTGEMNGELVFSLAGCLFIKGTRQGAVIGAGARASSSSDVPGSVTFNSGTYNIITNSRGAAIGGSAGSAGGSIGTSVVVNGGTISINTDYSGAAVGGGGYAQGNDSSGGTLTVNGGSLRPYVDKNAASNVNTGWNGKTLTEGVNDAIITAKRQNAGADTVYLCKLDTAGVNANTNGSYTVNVDGKAFYTGARHAYSFVYDGVDRNVTWNTTPLSTIGNWAPDSSDTNVYLYLTGKDHVIGVNGVYQQVVWSADMQTFTSKTMTSYPVIFSATPSSASVAVSRDGTVYAANSDGTYSLPDGTYDYSISAYGYATKTGSVTVNGASQTVTEELNRDAALAAVTFAVTPSDAAVRVLSSTGIVYPVENGVAYVPDGTYSWTITHDGYYASTCGFKVTGGAAALSTSLSASILSTYKLTNFFSNGTFTVPLETFTASANTGAWDGVTIDVSWYNHTDSTFTISTPAQLMGLAAIVNGIYNAEITTIIDDVNGDGKNETYTPAAYDQLSSRKIVAKTSTGSTGSNNLTTTNDYWYGGSMTEGEYQSDFNKKTVNLAADLDMGGYQDQNGNWTGARYMPIGGQYTMHYICTSVSDGLSKLSSSFDGTLNGNGHLVYNIYCDRYSAVNYGDSQSVGLIGRLGVHDSDYNNNHVTAYSPVVENVAAAGYIYARRSVGGIVGKTGHSAAVDLYDGSAGPAIRSCVNFATVKNTDSKGCGGIAGAGWNKAVIENCANFGTVFTSYSNAGGISGSCEAAVTNCYNVGYVNGSRSNQAQAMGTNNGGAVWNNCYWLTGSSYADSVDSYAFPAVYGSTSGSTVTEVTSFGALASADFLKNLNGGGRGWVTVTNATPIYRLLSTASFTNCKLTATGVNAAEFPVPRVFDNTDKSSCTSVAFESNPTCFSYIEGQTFDFTGLKIKAAWSDGTSEYLTDYTVSNTQPLTTSDKEITVSGTHGGQSYSRTYYFSVAANEISSISITSDPSNTIYAKGEDVSIAGMAVKAYYTNAPEKAINLTEKTAEKPDGYTWSVDAASGVLTVSYTYGNQTVTAPVHLTILNTPAPTQDESGFYLLNTANDLVWFANRVNTGFAESHQTDSAKLTADIDLTGTNFKSIGGIAVATQYKGTFNGNHHTVTLSLDSKSNYCGLIGYTGDGAVIRNLTIAGTVTSTANYVGAVVGYVNGKCTISSCVNKAVVTGAGQYTGGVVGYAAGFMGGNVPGVISITDCLNHGTVKSTSTSGYVGGVVAYTEAKGPTGGSVTASGCGNTAAVTGAGPNVGGVIGYAKNGANQTTTISSCYNTGAVSSTGKNYVGGVVGYVNGQVEATSIENIYNTGSVLGDQYVGGLVGYLYGRDTWGDKVTLTNSYTTGAVTSSSGNTTFTGAVIGSQYDGTVVANTYYLTGSFLQANGTFSADRGSFFATSKTLEEMKSADFAAALGSGFQKATCGTPTLSTQTDKATTPAAEFSADTGSLKNVVAGQMYRIDGGAWATITGSSADLSGLVTKACTIEIYQPGDNKEIFDSGVQTIQVTQAAKPTGLGTTRTSSKTAADGTITGVSSGMEYQKSGSNSWTAVTGVTVTGLAAGHYLVRVKAASTALSSQTVTLTVLITPKPEIIIDAANIIAEGDHITIQPSVFADLSSAITEAKEKAVPLKVDLSSLPAQGKRIVLPANLVSAVNQNDSDVELTMPGGITIFLNAGAASAIATAANNQEIAIAAEMRTDTEITAEDRAQADGKKIAAILDVKIVSNGNTEIHSLSDGKALVTLNCVTIKGDPCVYKLWHKVDGRLIETKFTVVKTGENTYDLSFEANGFSGYILGFEPEVSSNIVDNTSPESKAGSNIVDGISPAPEACPNTGDSMGFDWVIASICSTLSIMGAVLLKRKKAAEE
ncbi:MAG: hypothetical protein VB023_11580 [Oscillibacter sp.]|nr:hypothetical protein [Oscillibacter sp.]